MPHPSTQIDERIDHFRRDRKSRASETSPDGAPSNERRVSDSRNLMAAAKSDRSRWPVVQLAPIRCDFRQSLFVEGPGSILLHRSQFLKYRIESSGLFMNQRLSIELNILWIQLD
jgi:hypothetical protein